MKQIVYYIENEANKSGPGVHKRMQNQSLLIYPKYLSGYPASIFTCAVHQGSSRTSTSNIASNSTFCLQSSVDILEFKC